MYFGIVNSLLLNADQRGYIQYVAQIITLILNTFACYIIIKLGASIQIVKLTTSLIFLLRPLFLVFYVKKHYSIDPKITYTDEPIKQKWNGMAQHFASYVLNGTDNIVLTMLAKKETMKLNAFFGFVEWFLHTGTTLVFGCTGVLIVDFVRVYTYGINDADYIHPLFAVLITIANAGHCLRLPYNILILAAGHYKQTQSNYIIAMILNIVVSIATVKMWGLVGVAIGTLIAMAYQTVWMAKYDSKNIICWPFKNFLKQCGIDAITVIIASLATFKIPMLSVSYVSWFLLAIEVFGIWLIISIVINTIFYRERVLSIFIRVKRRFVN